ncbi:hypothetical protein [Streptomyces albipurpureus]|uniref:Secreted protein n=1 Tax=Streptomyces albipurpureus TaxID=2897419 RepID=A0ABT0UU15_9ACTN|nr:hypothetical protein [Streptomyces sp. CWNU-1]MCM2391105.1 hypothetical protein [Streptomyces sp. CWNU-1]
MPRGRHRHSPPLHKLLPPSAVAGASALCVVGSWTLIDPVMLRTLVAAAAAAAVTGAVMMRMWDREAGRQVADLTRGRLNDAWQTEERIAELEADAEASRDLRVKLDAKLRAKRVELAALRGEHAFLLRRYATAETERAGALEERRQLTIEATTPKALLSVGQTPTAAVYLRATKALDELTANAAAQQQKRLADEAQERDSESAESPVSAESAVSSESPEDSEPKSATKPASTSIVKSTGESVNRTASGPVSGAADESSTADKASTASESSSEPSPEVVSPEVVSEVAEPPGKPEAGAEEEHTRPAAAVPALRAAPRPGGIAPYGPRHRPGDSRTEGGFNFFGAQRAAGTIPPQDPSETVPSQREESQPPEAGRTEDAQTAAVANPNAPRPLAPVRPSTGPRPSAGRHAAPAPTASANGAQSAKGRAIATVPSVQEEDLADVVGEEAMAAQRDGSTRAVGDVIDLTGHEEPEPEGVPAGKLRRAVSS